MLNPDIGIQKISLEKSTNDYLNKSEICLFQFSNLKNKAMLALSEINSFNYDLSTTDQNELKTNLKSPLSEPEKSRYIKNANIDIPSSENLLKEDFKRDFLNNYDDSYAKFCGLNKEKFSGIYFSKRYTPNINEFGDINVSIRNILEELDNYSDSKKLKIKRRSHKRNRMKKKINGHNLNLTQNKSKNLFKVQQIDKIKDNNKSIIENLNNILNNNDQEKDKEETKKNMQSNIPLVENKKDIENNQNINVNKKGKSLLNIKKHLKNISIPGIEKSQQNTEDNNNLSNSISEKISQQNFDSKNSEVNNNCINNENNIKNNEQIISGNIEKQPITKNQNYLSNSFLKPILQSSNNNDDNNIFNFSSSMIQNLNKSTLNKSANVISNRQAITPYINNNNSNNNTFNMSLNNNLNINTPLNRPILSPINYSPNFGNILSPNIYHYNKSNISSPFLENNNSPFNNNIFDDNFIFNNMNTNSFFFGNNNDNFAENINKKNKNNDNKNGNNDDINNSLNNIKDKDDDNNN